MSSPDTCPSSLSNATDLLLLLPLSPLSNATDLLPLSAASPPPGLYYVASVAEECPKETRIALTGTIGVIIVFHVLLLLTNGFKGWFPILFGLGCHGYYSTLLAEFPFILLDDLRALATVGAAAVNVGLWMWHFWSSGFSHLHESCFVFTMSLLTPLAFSISVTGTSAASSHLSYSTYIIIPSLSLSLSHTHTHIYIDIQHTQKKSFVLIT